MIDAIKSQFKGNRGIANLVFLALLLPGLYLHGVFVTYAGSVCAGPTLFMFDLIALLAVLTFSWFVHDAVYSDLEERKFYK